MQDWLICVRSCGKFYNDIVWFSMRCWVRGQRLLTHSLYVVWAQGDYGRSAGSVLCIGTVDEKEPWKLTSDPVIISHRDYGWGNNDNTPVDEGPYAIIRDDKVFITFSESSGLQIL